MKTAFTIILVAGAIAAGLKLLVLTLEPKAAFYPYPGEQETPADARLPFERVTIRTSDGEALAAWWLPSADPAPDILFFHGNGGNLSVWSDAIVGIRRRGWTVFALDYRGYGLSTGKPTEKGIYRDADAFLDEYWSRRHRKGRRVVYWGRSLGATVAAYATMKRAPDALVLESPFASARTLISDSPVTRILGVFLSYRFPTTEFLHGYAGPALVVHGDADRIVPLKHGRRVYEALGGPKTLHVIPGANHNDLHAVRPSVYWSALEAFVAGAAS
ncbi:MAG TPA: alpha/beta hydrolase [Vicinamibacterales bacterium]|nr:alpha/beta hydrolase [Vicinamibacterales bacterium]